MVLREEVKTAPPESARLLRIIVGQPEARAVLSAWKGEAPPRPSTWDLFVSTLARVDAVITRAVLTGVEQERHFYARMDIQRAGKESSVECRPSDAIALALRSPGAQLSAFPEVLTAAGVLADGSRPPAPEADRTAPDRGPGDDGEGETPAPPLRL